MRRTQPVWHEALMDHSKVPPELVPDDEWVLSDYDSVFKAFRDDRIFSSHSYDQTISLVMGHTILAMGGKEHHDHCDPVAKAFRDTALERWEPSVIGPVCHQLVDEFKIESTADVVKALTFEFPTRIITTLLGLPPDDLGLFRRLSLDLISIPVDIEAELRGHCMSMPSGAQVHLRMGSANRDESRWDESNVLDIRRPRQAHIAFAGGIHSPDNFSVTSGLAA